jgi:hypothetical protein
VSYLDQSAIASNVAMTERVAQAATEEGQPEADTWTRDNRRVWASAPGWDDAWASALASHPPPVPPEQFTGVYDPGEDEAVITDAMILSQVQAMLGATADP